MAIWDCMLFNDEVALLDVRLRLLDGVVDHVVIVEGSTTFTGEAKRLTTADPSLDWSWFSGEVHVVVADLAEVRGGPWDRENAQRAAMGDYVRAHASPADLLLIGDVDELPDPAVLHRLEASLREPTRLWMDDALYYANWHQPRPWTTGPIATRLDGLEHPSVQHVLGVRVGDDAHFIEEYVTNAGWHLSFLGGPEAVARKLSAYSHQELNTDANRRDTYLRLCLHYGVHFAGWVPLRKLRRTDLDAGLRALADAHPALFDFTAPSSRLATLGWCGWAWIRTRLPGRMVGWGERHPGWLLAAAAPILIPLQVVRNTYRRLSPLPRAPRGKQLRPSQV